MCLITTPSHEEAFGHSLEDMKAHYVDHMLNDCPCTMFGTTEDEVQAFYDPEGPGYQDFYELSQLVRYLQDERNEVGSSSIDIVQYLRNLEPSEVERVLEPLGRTEMLNCGDCGGSHPVSSLKNGLLFTTDSCPGR